MKPSLAFIDHHAHKNTKSGDFLKKIFANKYKVKHFYISNNLNFDSEIIKYDNFFCFQILPPLSLLKKIRSKNIMWAPMYDSNHYPYKFGKTIWDIAEYFNIKVLFFSKKLMKISNNNSFPNLFLKYFKKNEKIKFKKKKKIDIFSWYRGDQISDDFIKLINPGDINKIYCVGLTTKKIERLKKITNKVINIKSDFIKKKKFLSLMKKTDVFICPRLKEGIGISHVEAISYGKYLIAHNDSTMNEYINNKKIGYLLKKDKGIIRINDIFKYQNYRNQYAKKGFIKYSHQKEKILTLFKKKTNFNYSFCKEMILNIKYIVLCINWKIKYVLKIQNK
jgi:hypothetical protein